MHDPSARHRNLVAALALILIASAVLWTLRPGEAETADVQTLATQPTVAQPASAERVELAQPEERSNAERAVEIEAQAPIESPPVPSIEPGVLAGRVTFTDGSVPPPIWLHVERYEPGRGVRPAADAVVRATGCRSEAFVDTDEDGHFRVEGLCPGSYRAACSRPESISANGLFEVPSSDAHYVLQGYLLIARAIDSKRDPVAEVHLLVETKQDPGGSAREPRTYARSKITDAQGEAWIAMSDPGDATIRVRGLGPDTPSDVVSLRMTPGIVRRDIYVPITPSRADLRVRLTACGDEGFRVGKFRIHLTPIPTPGAQSEPELNLTADSGLEDAVFRALPAGRYLVRVRDSVMGSEPADFFAGPDAQWTIELEDGRETLLSKCLRVGGHLRVLVRDACPTSHEPTVSARFELLDASGKDRVVFLSFREPLPDGLRSSLMLPIEIERYCDRVFEPGEHTLRVTSKGHADQTVSVTIQAGEATPLVVELEPEM